MQDESVAMSHSLVIEPPSFERVNELDPRLLGAAVSLNPWVANISPSRLQMFTSHLGQMLVVNGATLRQTQSGSEREYGKYVFNRKIKRESRIVEMIPRFRSGIDQDAVFYNPCLTLVLATSDDDGMPLYDVLDLDGYHSLHQSYGFEFKDTRAFRELKQGAVLPEGTVLKQSPNVTDQGDWTYGVETNVALMSATSIIEDGVRASESFCNSMQFKAIKKAVANCGGKYVPLNLYGDESNYKPFPDAGDRIKDHGVIIALRRFDPMTAPVDMTPKALMKIDYTFDKRIYGEPGATVTDIDVWYGGRNRNAADCLPVGMAAQFEKYHRQHSMYFERLLACYRRLRAQYGTEEPPLSPRFQRKLVEAHARLGIIPNGYRLQFTHKRVPLDDWRVEITYSYTVTPTIGFKITGTFGDKGVIVEKVPDEQMPIDAWGRRAHLIFDGDSTIKRMNPGRLYEHWCNAAAWHVRQNVIKLMDNGKTDVAWQYLTGFYKAGYPEHWELMQEYLERENKAGRGVEAIRYHMEAIRKSDIIRFLPPNSRVIGAEQVRRLRHAGYAPPKSTVSFIGRNGQKVTTVRPVLIGSMYVILLEKTGDDWSSVSSPRLQHFGIPAKLSRSDKQSTPGRESPVRFLGEDEVRLLGASCGGDTVAELLDQTNSPLTHKAVVWNILTAETPTHMKEVIDRSEVPRGGNRAVSYVKHLLQCGGVKFVFPEGKQ